MPTLPHYKNSKISMQNFEPIYPDQFDVIITPPASLTNGENWSFAIENIKKIDGLTTDQHPGTVEQIFRGAQRSFVKSMPDSTFIDLSITTQLNLNDENQILGYNVYREWYNLCWNPKDGTSTLKKDYIGGPITILLYNRGKKDQVRQWIFPVAFPFENIPNWTLDYSEHGIIDDIELKFRCDYFEDSIIGEDL